MTEILIAVLVAIAADRYIPDSRGLKPFSWYRDWAESVEERFNGGKRAQGIGALLLATVPIVVAVLLARYILGEIGWVFRFAFDVVALYLCLDIFRLTRTANGVAESLEAGDAPQADRELHELTGKGATEQTEARIAHDTVEAVLKQGNSLVVAPIFWFILLGPAGAVLQRLAAMLDMLWGHRYGRFVEFGWASARFDDVLGWIPARITAISYAIMGSFEDALHCWRRHMGAWSDINSGPILASGFGAMHMQTCEGPATDTEYEELGTGLIVVPDSGHVRRVVALVWRVLLFWLAIGILMVVANLLGVFAG